MNWFWAALCLAAAVALESMVREDVKTYIPRMCRRVIVWSAARLSHASRDRYAEEWSAALDERPELLGKLFFALSILLFAMPTMRRETVTCRALPGWKRTFDVGLIFLMLPSLVPIMMLICAVKLMLGETVFRSVRVYGMGGKPSMIYHFAVEDNGFGRMLWHTGLSEIPEAWSVARGTISFVGHRPIMVSLARNINPDDYIPGVTGEIYGLPATGDENAVYRPTLWRDIKAIARTFKLAVAFWSKR